MKTSLPRALRLPLTVALAPEGPLHEDPAVGRILRSFFVPSRPRLHPADVVVLAQRRGRSR
ncbi:MAG: hypothetical protein IPF92_04060 [Myxococcales bacterium]|nr:hypothetical protein [Myxococcales bacterium]MBL0197741.1 hypothetical protein [Myxococcales bacterium]HQY62373.1 hypothetical protein [Polyangiaceae bacterium]